MVAAQAVRLAEQILANLHREYPYKQGHVLDSDGDARPPRLLTPIFFGCFDWHSAVHSHWALVRLLPALPASEAAAVRRALADGFTAERAGGEVAHLDGPGSGGFEVPYGMAWLLVLAAELAARAAAGDDDAAAWRAALTPIEARAADRLGGWLERLPAPIRSGEHSQSAFAMGLALDWARATGAEILASTIERRARQWHGGDRGAPLAWEPSAYDFLSPCLGVADLMRRILPPDELAAWLQGFLPLVDLAPVAPADRVDGKLVHWDGLNLSRAWMLRSIAAALPAGHGRRRTLAALAERHAAAGLAAVAGASYMGSHWLPSFAVYWLTS